MIFWRKDKKEQTQQELPQSQAVEVEAQPQPEIVAAPVSAPAPVPEAPKGREGDRPGETWVSRMGLGLSKSTARFTQGISDLVTKKKLDQDTIDSLEELLITADLGPQTAAKVIADFSKDRFGKDLEENEIRSALSESLTKVLHPVAQPLIFVKPEAGPFVVLVCGVNGAGKTTTIGKIAHNLRGEGKQVTIAAGDTFRAAAVEQLKVWSDRTQSRFFAKDTGADAAAVAFEAYVQAKADGTDVLLIDTAGRLHNKSNLMAELQKIIRVLKKHDETLPHAVLLVLDSTTGQNAHAQVETFREMVSVTGLVVTKLDGSAKGGVVIGLADRFGLPIHLIGVGEGINDLQPFNPRQFSDSLVGLSQ